MNILLKEQCKEECTEIKKMEKGLNIRVPSLWDLENWGLLVLHMVGFRWVWGLLCFLWLMWVVSLYLADV